MALTIPVAEIVESSKNPLLGKHESWGRVLLGDIATIQNGFPFKSSQFTRDEGMPLIRIRDVGADNSDTYYVGDYDRAFIVKAGDLLIGMDGDFNCARWRGPDGLLNQRVCRVILKSDIYHPKLLDYALPGYLKAINNMTSSVTVKHLSSKSIAEIPLPLPPMDQQKRIVAEIEKQFSRLDEAVANLKRVKANLRRYKAAVLKAAVEGRLVETEVERARREGRSYETGAQLLQRILETRRSQWQGMGKYKEPAAPDTTDLPELPEGWVWATWDQISQWVTYGFTRPMPHVDEGIPIVTAKHVVDGKIELNDTHKTPYENYVELSDKDRPVPGDILITKDGTIGRAAVVPEHNGFCINQSVAVIWLRSCPIDRQFLLAVIDSELVQQPVREKARGVAIKHLSITDFARLPLPLSPIDEQRRIVSELDRHFSVLRETEAQIDANLQRAKRLRQSILSTAFSGCL